MKRVLEFLRQRIAVPEGLEFRPAGEGEGVCRLRGNTVEYTSVREGLFGLGMALAGVREGEWRCPFEKVGVMLDCSRNAVPRPEWIESFLVTLALLGFNRLELYMEDTFQCPGEPLFGFGRGGYSLEDLRRIDSFGAALGIEVSSSIQTLGHMEQILKFDAYSEIRDTPRILLADEEKTYALIEKMIAFQSAAFRSRNINLGFDEAVGLGQGRHLERFGAEKAFDIFLRHLDRVLEICRRHGMTPSVWSDMFFRANHPEHLYYVYDREGGISAEARARMPVGKVRLIYWDYYHWEEWRYRNMIRLHREMGFEPVMASMIWTPARIWYDSAQTEKTVRACTAAARTEKLREMSFTLWGDDGAYCDFDSAIAGLAFASGEVWRADPATLSARYRAAAGGDYEKVILASGMTIPQPEQFTAGLSAAEVLWDDPFLGVAERLAEKRSPGILARMEGNCRKIASELAECSVGRGGDLGHARAVCRLLSEKIALRRRMEQGCFDGETKSMALRAADAAEEFQRTFRRQWLRRNRVFGWNVMQYRIAGLIERFREIARRIDERSPFPEFEPGAIPDGVSAVTWHHQSLMPSFY